MRLLAAGLFTVWSAAVWAQAPAVQTGQPSPAREVRVTAIPGIISAGATWRIAWQGTDNADGLVGTPDGGLLFAQEQSSRVRKLDPDDTLSTYAENTDGAGAVALDRMGRLYAVQRTCTDPGLNAPCAVPTRVAIIHPARERRMLGDAIDGKPLGRLNDLVVSRQGVVYFTSGGAFSVRAGARVVAIGENLRANGIMLSPDERTLYVTNGTTIAAFDVQPDGSVRNQREFARLAVSSDAGSVAGSGDGMAIDAAGALYVAAQQAGVQVFSPEGKHLGTIPTPRNAISVAFSGRDRKTLYIVGSGALGADGTEAITPPGVRNNAKTIYRIRMIAEGFPDRAK
jgi:gluconolactonase